MKPVAEAMKSWNQQEIAELEQKGCFTIRIDNEQVVVSLEEIEIRTEDLPGFQTAAMGSLVVALDTTLTTGLVREGIAREVINRIQNLRKDKGFEVTDKITIKIQSHPDTDEAVKQNISYICSETLSLSLDIVPVISEMDKQQVELTDSISIFIFIQKND